MMDSFSGYFKTMCANAIEIQRLWPEVDRPIRNGITIVQKVITNTDLLTVIL